MVLSEIILYKKKYNTSTQYKLFYIDNNKQKNFIRL